jgi:DNA-binding response OmpR family regulator
MGNLNALKRKNAILCIEDDPDTIEMLVLLLTQAGYDVTQAGNITDGLALAHQGGFDLILLDWYFPDGTGIQLCRDIRKFDAMTPILFYTGEAHRSELLEAMSAGAHGYFIKPVNHTALLQTIGEYTGAESSIN